MRGLLVVALLGQVVVLPDGVYRPQRQPGRLEGQIGALITEHAEQLPTGEWLQLSAVLRRMGSNRYEVDYLYMTTGGKQRIEQYVEDIKVDRCPEARAEAIERVREAWAPRRPKLTEYMTQAIWNPGPCYQDCLTVTSTVLLPTDDRTSAACYRCLADAKDARDKAAKEQAEREDRARAALDAVDAACGEPKP